MTTAQTRPGQHYVAPLLTGFLGLTLALPAQAQQADTDSIPIASTHADSQIHRETYPADFFTDYAPRSANDMIGQIPGFQIEERDTARGLGQGGANILINGARLTGKSRASDQLSRISASNVERIEIVDGASLNIPGLSGRIANIIVVSGGMSGVWQWEPEWRSGAVGSPIRGDVSISGERGALDYTVNFEIDTEQNYEDGSEYLFNNQRTLLDDRFETNKEDSEEYIIGADLTWQPRVGHVAGLSTQYSQVNRNDNGLSSRMRATSAPLDDDTPLSASELLTRGEDEVNFRLGADYSFPLGAGTLKLIGDYRDELSPTITRRTTIENDVQTESRDIIGDEDEGERIIRAEYSWVTAAESDVQISAEGAFNFLDIYETRNSLQDGNLSTSTVDARVEEKRGEITLTYGRALTERLDMQSSLGVEYSEILQTDANLAGGKFTRDFVRPKGFINLAYAINESFTLRSRIEREVGQLDFGDLIDSADLQNDLDNASNPDLVPEQSWIANVELDKDFGGGNRLTLNLFGESIEDVVDRIPIGLTQEAVGNLEEAATRYGFELSGALRGERWGYEGVQTELTLNYYDTSLEDPLTSESRPINNTQEYFWSWAYRHDITGTDWAYGGGVNNRMSYPTYRLGAFVESESTDPRTYFYVEHKDIAGIKVEARLLNLLSEGDIREQTNYVGRRNSSDIRDIVRSEIANGPFFRLNFSGTF